jgi:uncharacterized membrane protein YdjX (TVP38/TMEM64 family)
METRSEDRKLLLKGIILVLFLSFVMVVSLYGPQPLGVPPPLWEELERVESVSDFHSRKERIARFLGSFGPYSAAIYVLLQALQVLASPIPGDLVGLLGGYAFGANFGFFLSMLGLVLGSWMAFELANIFGRPFVERWVKKEVLEKFDYVTTGAGLFVCFVLFLIPYGPKDYLCYLLGLGRMKVGTFLLIVTLGRMPGAYLLAFQGASVRNQEYGIAIAVALAVGAFLFLFFAFRRRIYEWVKARSRSVSATGGSPS